MDPLDLVGDVLDGQFRIEEFVGEGALSVVYRARSESLDAPVAVKCLDLPPTLDGALASSVVESFQEGCKLHYRLARGHLAIAQTFGSGTTVAPRTGAQVPYIVREWFDGESLARDLRRRRAEGETGRSLAETIAVFEPIASALAHAHAEGAEHLSLMPSNLFLAKKDDAVALKLLDFGVGRVVDEVASSRSGPTATTPPRVKLLLPTYAAPEQLLGTIGPTGPWTDVYALALVLLEVLSDRPVMSDKDATAIVARVLNKTLRPSPREHGVELPPGVERVLERALSLEPESRPGTVAEMWAELVAEAKPPAQRSERRRLAVHLRRLRRTRRADARRSERPAPPSERPVSPDFPADEPPTAKARGVVAMLTARAVRASTRPPPAPTKAPPKPATKAPPAPAAPKIPPKPRAPTLVGIAPPPATASASPPKATVPPHVETSKAFPPVPAIPPPPPELLAISASTKPAPSHPPPALDLPSVIVTGPEPARPAPPAPPAPAPPAPPLESSGLPEPHEISVPPLRIDRRVLVGVAAGAVVFLASLVVVLAITLHSSKQPVAAKAIPSATATATTAAPPTATATETASASAPEPPPAKFEKRVALAAIAESTKDLSDCRRPHGVWGKGQAGVVFKNDGTVRYVMMSPPFLGPEGKCVARHIKDTRIDPFVGIIGPIYANFVIPYGS